MTNSSSSSGNRKKPKEFKLSFTDDTSADWRPKQPKTEKRKIYGRTRNKPAEYILAFEQCKEPSFKEVLPLSEKLSERVTDPIMELIKADSLRSQHKSNRDHSSSDLQFSNSNLEFSNPNLEYSNSNLELSNSKMEYSVAKTAHESYSTIGTIDVDVLMGSSDGDVRVRRCQEETSFTAVPTAPSRRSAMMVQLSTVQSSDNNSKSTSCSGASVLALRHADDIPVPIPIPVGTEEPKRDTFISRFSAMAWVCFGACLLMGLGGVGVAVFYSSQSDEDVLKHGVEIGDMPFRIPQSTYDIIRNDVNGTTPQCRAYEWVLGDPEWEEAYSKQRLLQRFVLATLYYSMNGDEWHHTGGDTVELRYKGYNLEAIVESQYHRHHSRHRRPRPRNVTSDQWMSYGTNECDWFSLASLNGLATCNEDNLITSLYLDQNGLSGSLPPEIGLLTHLTVLDLSSGQLEGEIPTEVGLLKHLVHFNLAENSLISTIPSEVGRLTNLELFMTHNNNIEGTLPSEFYKLSNLGVFKLSSLQFAGSIPKDLGKLLPNIKLLDLQAYDITGSIPESLNHCSDLALLDLANNAMTGTIPTHLGSLPLGRLNLENNGLSGPLPSEFGLIPRLFSMDVSNNVNISGPFPIEFEQLNKTLEYLSIEGTSLTGTIPPAVCGIKNLKFDCSAKLCGCYCPCLHLSG